jgi:hypothetical protein
VSYSYSQLEALWIQAGGNASIAGMMASIALAESSGDPNATNNNSNSTTDRGLWQINSIWGSLSTYDVAGNAKAAVQVYNQQGITAWSTYQSGAYQQYYQGNTTPDNSVSTGSSGGVNGPYSPTSNPTVTLSPQELAAQYGYAYSMLKSIPELNTIFGNAVAGQWSATKFTAALMATSWYQTHSASQRAYIALGYADPSTQASQRAAQVASTQAVASKMGAVVPQNILDQLATQYLQNGWNADQLNQALSKYIAYDQYGALGGTAGDEEMTMRTLAQNNGVTISNNWILNTAQAIADNTSTLEDGEAYIRKQAENMFPNYAKEIKSGQNLSDLAAPYMQDYQKYLEVGPGQTTLFDPQMMKALQYKDPTGKNSTMPLWQFDTHLRQDPRWIKTQNAQDSIMSTAHTVLQNFGFSF